MFLALLHACQYAEAEFAVLFVDALVELGSEIVVGKVARFAGNGSGERGLVADVFAQVAAALALAENHHAGSVVGMAVADFFGAVDGAGRDAVGGKRLGHLPPPLAEIFERCASRQTRKCDEER